jgi:hypothetical protein
MLKLIQVIALILLGLGASLNAAAQDYNGIWHAAMPAYVESHGKPALQPAAYRIFTASEDALKSYLQNVPEDYTQAREIMLPTPEGGYRSFRIWNTPMMEAPLALKYPEITTYTAEATNNRQVTAKVDYTPFGFHAMVFDGDKTYLVDPYSGKADGAYIAYYKKDYSRADGQYMVCEADARGILQNNPEPVGLSVNGLTRRQYRLALAADSEYCIAVAGTSPTKSAVLSKMTTSMNRVNGIYQREFAVTMVFIAKEDTLIFNTTTADPYTNSSGSTMLGQNQTTVNARIGSANYDIGHVFSTGGGGIAQQGCVCQNSYKARGVTGSASPIGDAFDVDFVAHEMGHQYGAGHTFNASTGSCAGNGVMNISYEPGSGSTIMAYAGICGSGNDFQQHSDAYFHSASLEQISGYLTTGATCATTSLSPNTTNATVPAYTTSYNIPRLTPFELTAPTATDATADTLTYCWEQRDAGGADFGSSLVNTHSYGPLFRSFPPTTSPTRVFPAIARLLSAFSTPGEKLPDTSRTMTFSVTERDVYQGWGAFNFPNDAITLNVAGGTGPFTVNTPLGGGSWTGGTYQYVTWNVAGTTNAPISCSNVDILLSVDGGYTYPYTLAAATPNDGSEAILVPQVHTSTSLARVKVKGTGNVFFNINDGPFDLNVNPAGVSNALTDAIRVSPVPATSVLNVNIPAALGTVSARLVNPLGQELWRGPLHGSASVSVDGYPRGIYYLQLSGEGATVLRTVVLQ